LNWLRLHPDVEIRPVPTPDPALAPNHDATAAPQDSHASSIHAKLAGKRVFAKDERIWQAITGHGPDHQRVPSMEFEILSVIAAHGPSGVLQPSVTKITGQDKRSVPKRTDNLAEKGYIVKEYVIGSGTKTSLLKLKRFSKGQPQSKSDLPPPPVQPEPEHQPVLHYESLFNDTIHLLKANGNIITLSDLWAGLGFESGQRYSMKGTVRCIHRLAEAGCIRRLKSGTHDKDGAEIRPEQGIQFKTKAIQLLREPTVLDRMLWSQNDSRRKPTSSDPAAPVASSSDVANPLISEQGENTERDDFVDDLDLLGERSPPRWRTDIPFVNQLFNLVHQAGEDGIVSTDLAIRAVGPLWRRPIDEVLGHLTDVWQYSQPPHLRHLSLIRDTATYGKQPQYCYRTFAHFAKAADAGKAMWEAVSMSSKAKKQPLQELPDLDEWGFPRIKLKDLSSRDGRGTLSDGRRGLRMENMVDVDTDDGSDIDSEEEKIMNSPKSRGIRKKRDPSNKKVTVPIIHDDDAEGMVATSASSIPAGVPRRKQLSNDVAIDGHEMDGRKVGRAKPPKKRTLATTAYDIPTSPKSPRSSRVAEQTPTARVARSSKGMRKDVSSSVVEALRDIEPSDTLIDRGGGSAASAFPAIPDKAVKQKQGKPTVPNNTDLAIARKREIKPVEYEEYEEWAQKAAEFQARVELEASRKRKSLTATSADTERAPKRQRRASEATQPISSGSTAGEGELNFSHEGAQAELVAAAKRKFLERSTPGIYINPPGARGMKIESSKGKGRGRPRKALIAVCKSTGLHNLEWFKCEDVPMSKAPVARKRAASPKLLKDGIGEKTSPDDFGSPAKRRRKETAPAPEPEHEEIIYESDVGRASPPTLDHSQHNKEPVSNGDQPAAASVLVRTFHDAAAEPEHTSAPVLDDSPARQDVRSATLDELVQTIDGAAPSFSNPSLTGNNYIQDGAKSAQSSPAGSPSTPNSAGSGLSIATEKTDLSPWHNKSSGSADDAEKRSGAQPQPEGSTPVRNINQTGTEAGARLGPAPRQSENFPLHAVNSSEPKFNTSAEAELYDLLHTRGPKSQARKDRVAELERQVHHQHAAGRTTVPASQLVISRDPDASLIPQNQTFTSHISKIDTTTPFMSKDPPIVSYQAPQKAQGVIARNDSPDPKYDAAQAAMRQLYAIRTKPGRKSKADLDKVAELQQQIDAFDPAGLLMRKYMEQAKKNKTLKSHRQSTNFPAETVARPSVEDGVRLPSQQPGEVLLAGSRPLQGRNEEASAQVGHIPELSKTLSTQLVMYDTPALIHTGVGVFAEQPETSTPLQFNALGSAIQSSEDATNTRDLATAGAANTGGKKDVSLHIPSPGGSMIFATLPKPARLRGLSEIETRSFDILDTQEQTTGQSPPQIIRPYEQPPPYQPARSVATTTDARVNYQAAISAISGHQVSERGIDRPEDHTRMNVQETGVETVVEDEPVGDTIDDDLELEEVLPEPLNQKPARIRKPGVQLGDSTQIQRQRVIMDAIHKCGGVFPGDTELWYVVTTAWRKMSDQTPDRQTVERSVKILMRENKLKRFRFRIKAIKSPGSVTKQILALPSLGPDSAAVKELQRRMIQAYPSQYLPQEVEIADNVKPAGLQKSERQSHAKEGLGSAPAVARQLWTEAPSTSLEPRNVDASVVVSDGIRHEQHGRFGVDDTSSQGQSKQRLYESYYSRATENRQQDIVGPQPPFPPAGPQIDNQNGPTPIVRSIRLEDHVKPKSKAAPPGRANRKPLASLRTAKAKTKRKWWEDDSRLLNVAEPLLMSPAQSFSESNGTYCTNGLGINQETLDRRELRLRPGMQYRNHATDQAESGYLAPPSTVGYDNAASSSVVTAVVKLAIPKEKLATITSAAPQPSRKRKRYQSRKKPELDEDHAVRASDDEFVPRGASPPPTTLFKSRPTRNTKRVSKGGKDLMFRDRYSGINFKDADRLIIAIALTSAICGGINHDKYNWGLVSHALSFRYEGEFLRRRWAYFAKTPRRHDMEALRDAIHAPFLAAYERGELPTINFQDPSGTDWPVLLKWVQQNIPLSHTAEKTAQIPDLPSSREVLLENFKVDERNHLFELKRDEYFTTITDQNRRHLAQRYTFGNVPEGQIKPSERRNDDMQLLKSWIRAVAMTKHNNYNAEAAASKIGVFDPKLLQSVTAEMVESRIFVQDKRGRQLPGRNFQIHQDVLVQFRRWPSNRMDEHRHLQMMALCYLNINEHFKQHDHLDLVPVASDNEYTVLMNMCAQGMLTVRPLLPERQDEFDAPFPKLSPWGYGGTGYETKKVTPNNLKFQLRYVKTAAYKHEHELDPTRELPMEPALVDGEPAPRIPFWVDIHGNLIDDVWDMCLRSVLHILVFRAGSRAVDIEAFHQAKLWKWEVELILGWMEKTGLAVRCGHGDTEGTDASGWTGGWRAGSWWYCAFLPEMVKWEPPSDGGFLPVG
jgi:hypothetical protein